MTYLQCPHYLEPSADGYRARNAWNAREKAREAMRSWRIAFGNHRTPENERHMIEAEREYRAAQQAWVAECQEVEAAQ